MIKVTVNKESVECMVEGNLRDLCAETIILVKHIYAGIKNQNEDVAKIYEQMISKAFKDEIVFDDDKLKDIAKKMHNGDCKCDDEDENYDMDDLDDAIDSLKKFLEKLKDLVK